jgi:hypothetical protein
MTGKNPGARVRGAGSRRWVRADEGAFLGTLAWPESKWRARRRRKERGRPGRRQRDRSEVIQPRAARRGVTVTIVIDFIHMLKHVWNAAWSVFRARRPRGPGLGRRPGNPAPGRHRRAGSGRDPPRHHLHARREPSAPEPRLRRLSDRQVAAPRLRHRTQPRRPDCGRRHKRRLQAPRQRPQRHHSGDH